MAIDLEKVSSSIIKTGFHLEYKVGVMLREHGWHLISNRCYVDDHEGTVREIDLLAYKVNKVEDFLCFTVLVISCKKSEANAWAVLARGVEEKDPNYNWRPFKGWTNHPALSYYMKAKTWPHAYHDKFSEACPRIFKAPAFDVFAFQEMNKGSGSVQADKAIFSSITSLMKAQAYEMGLLANRRGSERCAYQFNLISVVDSELIRILFEGEKIESSLISDEDYLCRYILNKEEAIARIKFTTAEAFNELIDHYDEVHKQNRMYFSECYEKFYNDAYKAPRKSDLISADLFKAIFPSLRRSRADFDRKYLEIKLCWVIWNKNKERLEIGLDTEGVTDALVKHLHADEKLTAATKAALLSVYKYTGKFIFEDGIVF